MVQSKIDIQSSESGKMASSGETGLNIKINARTRQIIRYRATATLRRPQIKRYTASNEVGVHNQQEHHILLTKYEASSQAQAPYQTGRYVKKVELIELHKAKSRTSRGIFVVNSPEKNTISSGK